MQTLVQKGQAVLAMTLTEHRALFQAYAATVAVLNLLGWLWSKMFGVNAWVTLKIMVIASHILVQSQAKLGRTASNITDPSA